MPSLGVPELIIIFLIIVVLFGANKIPQIGKGLGEGIRNFKKGMNDGENEAAQIPTRPARNRRASSARPHPLTPSPEGEGGCVAFALPGGKGLRPLSLGEGGWEGTGRPGGGARVRRSGSQACRFDATGLQLPVVSRVLGEHVAHEA